MRISLTIFAMVASVWAQSNTGSLGGTVKDGSGAVLIGATVKLTNLDNGQVFDATASLGTYVFPSLPVGPYSLTAEHTGFKKTIIPKFSIAIAERSSLDVTMQIGDVNQSVEVTGAVPLLASESAEVGTSFQPKLMQDGPLFVSGTIRNPQSFVSFMPGVNGGSAGSIAGGSTRSAEILIDGASQVQTESGGVADFGQFPSVEQFGEFRLIMNTYSAEYGRAGSGIQKTVRTTPS